MPTVHQLRSLLVVLSFVAAFASTPSASFGRTLYGVNETNDELLIVDPANGTTIASLGTITHPDGITLPRALAVSPLDGKLYAVLFIQSEPPVLGTVDGQAAFTEIGEISPLVRDMTFDSAGKLWAVTGGTGSQSNSLISIDTADAVVTFERFLPVLRNKLAYDPDADLLYLLGDAGAEWELYSFPPSDPMTFTEVDLSGEPLSGMSQPPMVFDQSAGLLRTMSTSNDWVSITSSGVVALEASSLLNFGGMAFDHPLFADGFETGDTTAWSSSTPTPR